MSHSSPGGGGGGGGGSLASRMDHFKKKPPQQQHQQQQGIVSIEIEQEDVASTPKRALPRASPLVDYDTGPSTTPPSLLTISPGGASASAASSSRANTKPGEASRSSLSSQSPKSKSSPGGATTTTTSNSPRDVINTSSNVTGSSSGGLGGRTTASTQPFPVDQDEITVDDGDTPNHHQGLVTLAKTRPEVVLRRKPNGDSTDSSSGSSRMRRLRHRASAGRSGSPSEAGRLLKLALARHFKQDGNVRMGEDALDDYVCEVFQQLDYRRRGAVSREDFETLCEVLSLPTAPPSPPPGRSQRNSGLEWLSSYRPRPDSPVASPLRVDRLGEVKYRHPSGSKKGTSSQSPNFLFTLGERPFWELWPQRKWRRRPKKLTLDEFKRSLLEQYAKSQGLSASSLGTVLPVVDRRRRLRTAENGHHRCPQDLIERVVTDGHTVVQGRPVVRVVRVRSESKARRMIRNLKRRYHFLDRLSRSRKGKKKNAKPVNGAPAVNGTGVPAANGEIDGKSTCQVHIDTTGPECSDHCNNNNRFGGVMRRLSRLDTLRERVAHQQEEISTLREVVQDLRSSLQLSDAQNLALQVLLRKVAKAEGSLPRQQKDHQEQDQQQMSTSLASVSSCVMPGSLARNSAFRSRMDESERQLENLVRELKEMSQVRYPTLMQTSGGGVSNNNQGTTSSSASTTNVFFSTAASNARVDDVDGAIDDVIEERLEATAEALGGAGHELAAAEEELSVTADRLLLWRNARRRQQEHQEDSELAEAYRALERAMQELNRLRNELDEARCQLESTKGDLNETQEELVVTKCRLRGSEQQLRETEKRLNSISQNRRSLVLELQATRELLASSLNKVQGLELESKKVPILQGKIKELERHLRTRRPETSTPRPHSASPYLLHPLRPLSTIDSGLYSSSSEAEDQEGGQPRPRRHPSGPGAQHSPHGAGVVRFADEEDGQQQPVVQYSAAGSEALRRLRAEIRALKDKFVAEEKSWQEERNVLLDELIRRQDASSSPATGPAGATPAAPSPRQQDVRSDLQVLEAQRVRLSLLEEKIKEILNMIRSLNQMNISSTTLGKLVLDSVDRSIDPLSGEVQVFRFLNCLYHSARDYERMAAEKQIHNALRAVQAHSSGLARIEEQQMQQQERRARSQEHQVPSTKASSSSAPAVPVRSTSLPPRSAHVYVRHQEQEQQQEEEREASQEHQEKRQFRHKVDV